MNDAVRRQFVMIEADEREAGSLSARACAELGGRNRVDEDSTQPRENWAQDESEHRFRLLCEQAPMGIFVTDQLGNCIHANRQCCHLTGFDLATTKESEWIRWVHTDDRQQVADGWQSARREGRAFDSVYRVQGITGETLWVRCHMVPRWDDGARASGFMGTLTDVSEHKKVEAALQIRVRQQSIAADLGWLALRNTDLHEFAQTACEGVADGLGAELCKVLELLPGGDRLLLLAGIGWDEGLVGHATVETHRSSQAGFTLESDEPVVVEDLPAEKRFEGPPLLTDHGVVSGVSVVVGGTEHPYGVLGVHTRTKRLFTSDDISFLKVVANLLAELVERKTAEKQLRQHHQTLTHVSRLSTMGEMLAGITHEISQPLHAISNFASASITALRKLPKPMNSRSDTEKQLLEWNTEVRNAAARASEILQRMRRFSRKGGYSQEAVNLNDLLREAIELAELESRMAQVTVQTDLDESLPELLCDRVQIQQVVVNLLLNAFEALAESDNRSRLVIVRSCLVDHNLTIQIVDNGPGIPDDGQYLFEPFHTTKRDGMGMGLAISKTIVEGHGGQLHASNNEVRGATFQMAFPLSVGNAR